MLAGAADGIGRAESFASQLPESSDGQSKTEKKIRAIVAAALTQGYNPLCIPIGGKSLLREQCMKSLPELFGGGPAPFDKAWKSAVNGSQPRLRMADHYKFAQR